jgi:hypothetical protein
MARVEGAIEMLIVILLLWFVTIPSPPVAQPGSPQSCNPAALSYLIRDENGSLLSEADLKTLVDQLAKAIGDASLVSNEVSFKNDGQSYYWPESADVDKGHKQPALLFANAGTCTMHLSEVTLNYHGRKMRLIFDLDITRTQPDRRIVVDSLPFQAGTFKLTLNNWTHDPEKMIPAWMWKKVKKPGRSR